MTSEEDIIDLLTKISTKGFTNLQAKAYLSLLKLGEGTGSAIAEQAGINRSKIYDVLGDLELMGAVRRISREGKTIYVGIDPNEVLEKLKGDFIADLEISKKALERIKNTFGFLDEASVTLSRMQTKNLNINDFSIMISTTQRARGQLLELLPPENRPSEEVTLLELGKRPTKGDLIMLIGDYEVLLFNAPTSSQIKNVLRFLGREFSIFFKGIVNHLWDQYLPQHIIEDIQKGDRLLLAKEMVTLMRYRLANGAIRNEHLRPVPMLITDTHISFIYLDEEDPKIPIKNIKTIKIENGMIFCDLYSATGNKLATLEFKPLSNTLMIRNLISVLISDRLRN